MDWNSEQKFGVATLFSHRASQLAERQETLIVGPREPLRRNPADALAARDIHFVADAHITAGVHNLGMFMGKSP